MSQTGVRPRETRSNVRDLTGFPAAIVAKCRELEAEMDDLHLGWRVCEPWNHLQIPHWARISWCIKRYVLLSWRDGHRPAPRDWDVHVTIKRGGGGCYAHPIFPYQVRTPDMWTPPPLGATEIPKPRASASELSFALRIPVETVERLLPYCPPGEDARDWLPGAAKRVGMSP